MSIIGLLALTVAMVTLTSTSQKRGVSTGGDPAAGLAWVPFSTPDGTLRFELPGEPATSEDGDGNVSSARYETTVANASFRVSTHDYATGFGGVSAEQWLNRLPSQFAAMEQGTASNVRRIDVGPKPAIRYDVRGGDERQWYVADVFLGSRVVRVSVVGPGGDPSYLDHVLGSMEFLDPTTGEPPPTR